MLIFVKINNRNSRSALLNKAERRQALNIYEAYLLFAACLIGCGIHAWNLGRRAGIEGTVQYLIDEGVLPVEDE